MMKHKLFLCMIVALLFAFPLSSFATINDTESVNMKNGMISTNPVLVSMHHALLWRVENTGTEKLYYHVISLSSLLNSPVVKTVEDGVVEPGKTHSHSVLGVGLEGSRAFIVIEGETTGNAQIMVR